MATEPKNEMLYDDRSDIDHDLKQQNIDHAVISAHHEHLDDAFLGETREHEMGTWEAVKNYPMACFWAFLMCFTIVSLAQS